ncbi:MAG: glucose-6-phosphate isomerase [Burkholderiaceae bacterium]
MTNLPNHRTRGDQTAAWAALQQHFDTFAKNFDVRDAFAADANRFETLSQQAPYVFADLSKNRLDAATQALLMDLARQSGVEAHRDAMFAGEKINNAENRAVMHWLLRTSENVENNASNMPLASVFIDSLAINNIANSESKEDINTNLALVHQTLTPMLAYAEHIRADAQITDIVNIGIGGSDLGPLMAVLALDSFATTGKRLHFVSNVDGHELAAVLKSLKAENTLFLVASKTFTTIETMTNALSAKAWFEANYGDKSALLTTDKGNTGIALHFAALTTNVAAANNFGISTTFGFWDWVGGRYSMWSAIGLPIAIAIGAQGFKDMLAGASAMDEHFRTAPLEANLPVKLGLLDVWYRNFHGFTSRCVAPYHSALKRLPAYLQQLEMESNGKQVDANGQMLPFSTSAVVWGEPGTNGQHAFFQMLHQGTDVVPVEFIAVKNARHNLPGHQQRLLANAVAQAQALMMGKADAGGHKNFPGNRPSTTMLLEDLTPASFGALIALYEHRVFVAGSVWGINSFDQWGVELGKVLAVDIEKRMSSGDMAGLDGSTQGLLKKLRV